MNASQVVSLFVLLPVLLHHSICSSFRWSISIQTIHRRFRPLFPRHFPLILFAFIPLPFILFIGKIHFLGKYSIKIQQFPQDKWVRSVHFVQQSLDSLFRQPFARIFFLFCIFLISISSIINLLGNVTGQWLLLIEIQTLGKRRKRALRRQTGI